MKLRVAWMINETRTANIPLQRAIYQMPEFNYNQGMWISLVSE